MSISIWKTRKEESMPGTLKPGWPISEIRILSGHPESAGTAELMILFTVKA